MKMSKTVLITGASKGLGKALSEIYSRNGYEIIAVARDSNSLNDLKKIIGEDRCTIIIGDITQSSTIEKIERIAKEKGIDILINNAGVAYKNSLNNMENDQIDEMINVNLIAPINLTKRLYPILLNQKNSIIVNISSTNGIFPALHNSVYCATKYGLKGFTESLRLEAKDYGIRIIGVYPGGMDTDLFKNVNKTDNPNNVMRPQEAAQVIFESCTTNSIVNDIVLRKLPD